MHEIIPASFSPAFIWQTFDVLLTIGVTMVTNIFFRSMVKLPKRVHSRQANQFILIVRNIITILLCIIAIHIIALIIGFNITPLITSVGLIGVVTAIVANSVIGDLVNGFFLVSQANISVGDYVFVAANIEGTITSIGIKNMTLMSNDGSLIIIPNGQIKTITNYSHGKTNTSIDITLKMTTSPDLILQFFEEEVKQIKKDKDLKITDQSRVAGIKNFDSSAGTITITTILITSSSMRGKIEYIFRYNVLKHLSEKQFLQEKEKETQTT